MIYIKQTAKVMPARRKKLQPPGQVPALSFAHSRSFHVTRCDWALSCCQVACNPARSSKKSLLQFEKVDGMLSLHAIPDAFTISECALIIAMVSEASTDEALLVGRNKNHNLRKAELVWTDNVAGMEWVMERLIEIVRSANRDQYGFDLHEFAESPQVAIYKSSDSGHFAWHSDIGGGPASGKRKLTLVLQLSAADTYEGGDLEVMPGAQILTASRAQGCASVFPSFTLHQVTPVKGGIRYSLTVWAHGPAFR